MHDQAGRLVDDHDVVVLVDDVEVDRFRRESGVFRRRLWRDDDGFVAVRSVLAASRLAVDGNVAAFEPQLQAAARELRHQGGDHLVQALAAMLLVQRKGDGRQIDARRRREPALQLVVQVIVVREFRRTRRRS